MTKKELLSDPNWIKTKRDTRLVATYVREIEGDLPALESWIPTYLYKRGDGVMFLTDEMTELGTWFQCNFTKEDIEKHIFFKEADDNSEIKFFHTGSIRDIENISIVNVRTNGKVVNGSSVPRKNSVIFTVAQTD